MMARLKVRPLTRRDGGKSVVGRAATTPRNRGVSGISGSAARPSAKMGLSRRTIWTVLRSLLSFSDDARSTDRQLADTRGWTFTWPAEVQDRDRVAPIEQFAAWLRDHGRRELTRRQLVSQYWEWIEITETRPLSWPAFDRSLRSAGIQKVRLTTGTREYRYRLAPARPKLVASTEARDQAIGERRSVA